MSDLDTTSIIKPPEGNEQEKIEESKPSGSDSNQEDKFRIRNR